MTTYFEAWHAPTQQRALWVDAADMETAIKRARNTAKLFGLEGDLLVCAVAADTLDGNVVGRLRKYGEAHGPALTALATKS